MSGTERAAEVVAYDQFISVDAIDPAVNAIASNPGWQYLGCGSGSGGQLVLTFGWLTTEAPCRCGECGGELSLRCVDCGTKHGWHDGPKFTDADRAVLEAADALFRREPPWMRAEKYGGLVLAPLCAAVCARRETQP